ncbi:MAG: hypothetical protein A2V93_10340 [Ignavibacteria bacterium RBG_16_34_14]|nr:MAG: hypothetical protein A2V93_10340 [Ignavibacteria bacterium RBG_16_34_14]
MNIPVIDKSNYLKGLLITARKDNQLADSEKKIIRSIAEKLGFASDFYEETIQNLLANKYIDEGPIKFSDIKIAESFIIDGLRLAYSDSPVESGELEWLRRTAIENGINEKWFDDKLQTFKTNAGNLLITDFALLSII